MDVYFVTVYSLHFNKGANVKHEKLQPSSYLLNLNYSLCKLMFRLIVDIGFAIILADFTTCNGVTEKLTDSIKIIKRNIYTVIYRSLSFEPITKSQFKSSGTHKQATTDSYPQIFTSIDGP